MSNNNENKRLVSSVVLGVLIVTFVMGFSINQIANATHEPKKQDDWRGREIKALHEALEKSNLSEEARKSLVKKLNALSYEATQRAIGFEQLTAMPTEVEAARKKIRTPKPTVIPKRDTGIIDYPPVPLPASTYDIISGWQQYVNDRYIIVYAGSFTQEPDQGIIIVFDDKTKEFMIFPTPTKEGRVRITAEKQFHLTLETMEKNIYYFDVMNRAYVGSPNEEGPLSLILFAFATNLPTATSVPYPNQQ